MEVVPEYHTFPDPQATNVIYIYIYIYMEHPFLMFLDHTQRQRGKYGELLINASRCQIYFNSAFNSLNTDLTLMRLMSYICIYMDHPFLMFLDHTQRRNTVEMDSSGQVIRSSQRPLPDNTRQSQQTNIHAPGGIRTQDLSRRTATGLSPAEIMG